MADTPPIQLYINHALIVGMEWGMTCEEVLGGTGSASIVLQDRAMNYEPQSHWDVKVVIRSSGWVLFRGEIIRPRIVLKTGVNMRWWNLECSDYNDQMSQRKVGAFDGRSWIDIDKMGDYVLFDKYAHTLKTDKATIQRLFDHYVRVDRTSAVETSRYVFQYINKLGDIDWEYSDVEKVIQDLASMIASNVQDWLDPDLYWHHQAIPPWQDVAQQTPPSVDSADSQTSGMMPEAAPDLDPAPYNISDVRGTAGCIGLESLDLPFDGSNMPEQLYVRGATGFVYNNPAPATTPDGTTVVEPDGYGYDPSNRDGVFNVHTNATTLVWHQDANGLIESSSDTVPTGADFQVQFVAVTYSPANGKGGDYWKIISGPSHVGWLFDNDTNVYIGYGSITVTLDTQESPTGYHPKTGIGGSGWVGDDLLVAESWEDGHMRQAYLEAPISDTKKKRDQIGAQVLYRASFPTLRGTLTVNGGRDADNEPIPADGWRCGQIVTITDGRLPAHLSGKKYVIQRVKTSLLAETNLRRYQIDFGDGPTSRYTYQMPKGGEVPWPPPAVKIDIQERDLAPGPNHTQIIVGQLVNKEGAPWRIKGRIVKWTLEVYNRTGDRITGQGSLKPTVSNTDAAGRARTKLTTGSMTGLVYFVFADVQVE